mmetsp:Transcript_21055/g.50264  ORF Transcript_21055/g.50264 Transcript_21055/m.50264 type:complete len:526 (+) Transcript_21055:557-2134(+)
MGSSALRVCVVLEATAVMGQYFKDIYHLYLQPLLRRCHESHKNSVEFALILYGALPCSDFVVQRSRWTLDVDEVCGWLDGVAFTGGALSQTALAEALVELVYMCKLGNNFGCSSLQCHCILVACSDPSRRPVCWPFPSELSHNGMSTYTEIARELKPNLGICVSCMFGGRSEKLWRLFSFCEGPDFKEESNLRTKHLIYVLISNSWPEPLQWLQEEHGENIVQKSSAAQSFRAMQQEQPSPDEVQIVDTTPAPPAATSQLLSVTAVHSSQMPSATQSSSGLQAQLNIHHPQQAQGQQMHGHLLGVPHQPSAMMMQQPPQIQQQMAMRASAYSQSLQSQAVPQSQMMQLNHGIAQMIPNPQIGGTPQVVMQGGLPEGHQAHALPTQQQQQQQHVPLGLPTPQIWSGTVTGVFSTGTLPLFRGTATLTEGKYIKLPASIILTAFQSLDKVTKQLGKIQTSQDKVSKLTFTCTTLFNQSYMTEIQKSKCHGISHFENNVILMDFSRSPEVLTGLVIPAAAVQAANPMA